MWFVLPVQLGYRRRWEVLVGTTVFLPLIRTLKSINFISTIFKSFIIHFTENNVYTVQEVDVYESGDYFLLRITDNIYI